MGWSSVPGIGENLLDVIEGLSLTRTDDETITIGTGSCLADDSASRITLSAALPVDLSGSGDGGLDTGAEAASTQYYLWVFATPGGAVARFSLSSTAPTEPATATGKRYIGPWFNDSGSDLANVKITRQGMTIWSRQTTRLPSFSDNGTGTSYVAFPAANYKEWSPPTAHTIGCVVVYYSVSSTLNRTADLYTDGVGTTSVMQIQDRGVADSYQARRLAFERTGSFGYTTSIDGDVRFDGSEFWEDLAL